jgi:hypothetical protein
MPPAATSWMVCTLVAQEKNAWQRTTTPVLILSRGRQNERYSTAPGHNPKMWLLPVNIPPSAGNRLPLPALCATVTTNTVGRHCILIKICNARPLPRPMSYTEITA